MINNLNIFFDYFFDEHFKLEINNLNQTKASFQTKISNYKIINSKNIFLLIFQNEIFFLKFLKFLKKMEKVNYKLFFYSNKIYGKNYNNLKYLFLKDLTVIKKKFLNLKKINLEKLNFFLKNILEFKRNCEDLCEIMLNLKKYFLEIFLQELSKNLGNKIGQIKILFKKKKIKFSKTFFFITNFSIQKFLKIIFSKIFVFKYLKNNKNDNPYSKKEKNIKNLGGKLLSGFFFSNLLKNFKLLQVNLEKRKKKKSNFNKFRFPNFTAKIKSLLDSIIFNLQFLKIKIFYLSVFIIKFKKKHILIKNLILKYIWFFLKYNIFFMKKKSKKSKKSKNLKNHQKNMSKKKKIKKILENKNVYGKIKYFSNFIYNNNLNNLYLSQSRFFDLQKEFFFFWKINSIILDSKKKKIINQFEKKNFFFIKRKNLKLWKNFIYLKRLVKRFLNQIKILNQELNKKFKIEKNYEQKFEEIKTMEIDFFLIRKKKIPKKNINLEKLSK